MNILFVHQNFPSQYTHILRALSRQGGHRLVGLGIEPLEQAIPQSVEHRRYGLQRGNTTGIHPLILESETKVLRAEACAEAAEQLKAEGFKPDLICAHPGWGEALFLSEIWPDAPLLCYQEFFYNSIGFDCDFDPGVQGLSDWKDRAKIQMKNANLLLSLERSRWNVAPTAFQRSSFPSAYQGRFSAIHDGIDTHRAAPADQPFEARLPNGLKLRSGMPVVTFVNRRLEPYRGCHTMLRAIPELQRLHPEAHVVIVGDTEGVSYGASCPKGEWRERFLSEINGEYDPTKLHFVGRLSHQHYLSLLKLSACHVYLTYPFVLSWSLLEAMACGCPVVGSATAPVMEVIQDGRNGLLVDFFQPNQLAAAISELLNKPEHAKNLGAKARKTVLLRYSLEHCVPQHLALMQLVASGSLPH
jgi:glycosyltransferase involved in cell wall biosynthesis